MDKELFAEKINEIEKIIYSYIPLATDMTERIVSASEYSVKAGGKRLRPMIMRESFIMLAGNSDGCIDEPELLHAFMAAIEFIHTYSLVHDDLPAMDNDLLRRGKPSTHAAFGEAFGVLTGDALLNKAVEIVADSLDKVQDADLMRRGVKALSVLMNKAGISGMIGGQCLDVYSDKNSDFDLDLEKIIYIYKNKTSALLEASMVIGAILAGADDDKVRKLEQIASNVGMAFQIRDDILDITATTEQLGKPVGSDEKNNKNTYVSIKGLQDSQKDVETFSDEAVDLLDSIEEKNDFLRELILMLASRDK